MKREQPAADSCRHNIFGYCTNRYWEIMRSEGKNGLQDYYCTLWLNKLNSLKAYHDASFRASRLGATPEKRRQAADRAAARQEAGRKECPEYRPVAEGMSTQCRYYFLETCLFKLPECRGVCDDFVPEGDQS